MEDKLLIQQAMRGSTEAFAELYSKIYKDMYRLALYALKNQEDAEDCVSETVMDAWAQIGKLRQEESFRAWMFKILSNKCKKKLQSYLTKTEEIPETLAVPEQEQEIQMDVQNAFTQLSAEDRLIVSMHVFGGYTSAEIGKTLNIKDNTVRSRHKRALEKMAEYLGGKGGHR